MFQVLLRQVVSEDIIFLSLITLCVCVCALQIIDEEETQYMTNCPPAVTESTPRRRTSIQVFWTAPPSGSGCVAIKYVYRDCLMLSLMSRVLYTQTLRDTLLLED